MEKIKNLINPGRAQDNETLYGSGTNTGNTETTGTHGGLTGEGSHLASSTGNTSGLAGSQATGTSGIGSTNTGVASEASTDQAGRGIGNTGYGQSSQTSGLPGQGSHLSGARDTTSGTSGLAGNQTSGLGNTSNTAGTGSTSGLTGNQTSGLGNTNTSSTGQSNLARDAAATAAGTTAGNTRFAHQGQSGITSGTTTTTSSHMPGSWDDSYEQGSGNTGFGGANTSTGLGSGTVNPSTTQGTGQLGSSTGTSGLSQDPNTSSGHHLSRDAAAIGTAGTIGEGVHHHRENERGLGNTGSSANDSGLGTAKVYPPTTSHSTHLGSGSNYPSTASGTSGYTSTLPDRTLGSQQPGSTTGYGTGQSGNTSSGHQLGRDAAALGTAGAVGEGIHHHEHDKNLGNQEYTGTNRFMPLSSSTAQTGTSGSQPLASNTGYGSNQSGNTSSGHHLGRDAAAVGAAGAVGEGIHHHRENERGLGSTGATSGSHSYGSTTGVSHVPLSLLAWILSDTS
ncbi:uncharacterized protein LY89DRAFT_378172 [Mollisia scopiformis]|uniref:Uncharacterized protein n=1 Tax=Mollisia scopiformis TaxID=149040 RepID=A0A194XPB8_MOLSC|nr:uncharacterized protein LY89DRAFT_378172 [Mollisia scopiformis]KUJ21582.1 hypothetical protein LY89DRAFT_378172 [Mollisia scopiformis]